MAFVVYATCRISGAIVSAARQPRRPFHDTDCPFDRPPVGAIAHAQASGQWRKPQVNDRSYPPRLIAFACSAHRTRSARRTHPDGTAPGWTARLLRPSHVRPIPHADPRQTAPPDAVQARPTHRAASPASPPRSPAAQPPPPASRPSASPPTYSPCTPVQRSMSGKPSSGIGRNPTATSVSIASPAPRNVRRIVPSARLATASARSAARPALRPPSC